MFFCPRPGRRAWISQSFHNTADPLKHQAIALPVFMAISPFSPASYKPVCQFWSKGCCKYDSNYRFLHPDHQSLVAVKKLAHSTSSTAHSCC
ncbi:hypothetical protein SLEP1_g6875 [Rubroshorea leprosula]|uniref:C3H1-type domain-containing protein n=1 Tax=Rubroshorea leprosula TaxID=152421 RepID=A0AAV5I2G4_9ROSI|nr:hypothetical protein SLEP1_g6875 [Rubroshorea leprosula]